MQAIIADRVKKIQSIYRGFLFRLFKLEKEQDAIIQSYQNKKDEAELAKIRKSIDMK